MKLKQFIRRAIENAPIEAVLEYKRYKLQMDAIINWTWREKSGWSRKDGWRREP